MSQVIIGIYGPKDTSNTKIPLGHGERESTYVHDHSVTILRDGRLIACLPLERLTGVKHDNSIEKHITKIIDNYVNSEDEVIFAFANSFIGSSFCSDDGNLRIEPNSKISVTSDLIDAEVYWFPKLKEAPGINRREAAGYIVSHEFAHIASALQFTGYFRENSLLVHIDGGASKSSNSFWYFNDKKIKLLQYGWGELHTLVSNFNSNPLVRCILSHQSWQHLSIPGKLMGYSSLGESNSELREWLYENNWFRDMNDSDRYEREKILEEISSKFSKVNDFNPREKIFMDICATIQSEFEEYVLNLLNRLKQETKAEHLVYSGGAALNIITNSRIESECGFKSIFVPPCTSDSGLSLGAAIWVDRIINKGSEKSHSPFIVGEGNFSTDICFDDIDETISMLLEGKVIGICNGKGEIGPRALGNRSIISMMNSVNLRRKVSETIKKREWYRPLAPIICSEAADVVLPESASSNLSRYMLGSWEVSECWHDSFHGVIHSDGTVRAQVVPNDPEYSWIHELLSRLWNEYQIPGLINTSFNKQGEPILHYHKDAKDAAINLGLDAVVVEGVLDVIR